MLKFSFAFACITFSLITKGQFFANEGQPCAVGKDVKLDSLLYSPDSPLPFDRCFNLKLKIPADAIPDYFTITPIDKFGNKDVRKRDYRVFLKSLFPDLSRSSRSKFMTWGQFKDPLNKGIRPFNNIKQLSEGKNPEYVFRISPLDPARYYQLVVINHVPADLEKIRSIEQTILSSSIPSVRITKQQYSNSKDAYEKIISSYRSKGFNLGYPSFMEFFSKIDDYSNLAFINYYWRNDFADQQMRRNKDDVTRNKREYKFFIVPASAPFVEASANALLTTVQLNATAYNAAAATATRIQDNVTLPVNAKIAAQNAKNAAELTLNNSKRQFFTLSTTERLEFVSMRSLLSSMEFDSTRDINENLVNYFAAGNYDIYAMLVDTVTVFKRSKTSRDTVNHDFLSMIANVSLLAPTPRASDQINFNFTSTVLRPSFNNGNAIAFRNFSAQETALNARIGTAIACLNQTELNNLMKEALLCPCEDKGVKDITQRDDLLRSLSLFFNFPRHDNFIRNGITSSADPSVTVQSTDIAARMANLKVSINHLKLVKEFVAKVEAKYNNVFGGQYNCLNTIETELTASLQNLTTMSVLISARHKYYTNTLQLHGIAPLTTGSSRLTDLKAASKFRIVPDFGLVGIFKGSKIAFQDLTPYLGFHINFRSIDKDIEMGDVKFKSWRHYFSFMGGITLRSLKIEGKREDFFNSNNLLTGFGFRLNNYLRITGGVVWFRKLSTNPLSSEKPLGFSGFSGLSLDLELRDLFDKLNKLF